MDKITQRNLHDNFEWDDIITHNHFLPCSRLRMTSIFSKSFNDIQRKYSLSTRTTTHEVIRSYELRLRLLYCNCGSNHSTDNEISFVASVAFKSPSPALFDMLCHVHQRRIKDSQGTKRQMMNSLQSQEINIPRA